ncbi:putative pentatricopeptide repeat-containing protein At3g23330 [Tasmannia lanceolata]|uniref:putative pentatricopeptide repeat-containing protein At3g23330 n=1 Tax=Tasmannia lanceolata TaxID=3420 RepID=UPI00406359EB
MNLPSPKLLPLVSTAFHWNLLIKTQVGRGSYREALKQLSNMNRAGVQPDNFTFPLALKACTGLSSLSQGQQIHGLLISLGFEWNPYAQNALICMYSGCGNIKTAFQVFDKMPHRNTITWNSIIAGCVHNGLALLSLSYFSQMILLSSGADPDSVTMSTVLHAIACLGDCLRTGKEVHAQVIRREFQAKVTVTRRSYVENALIHMYLESSCLIYAERIFQQIPMEKRDLVRWTTMISGYARYKLGNLAITAFRSMVNCGIGKPDPVSFAAVMPSVGSLQEGKEMHCFAIRSGFDDSNAFVASSLLHMYAELGSISCAAKFFERILDRNVVVWTVMIMAYAKHGQCEDSLKLFEEMRTQTSVIPNCLTFMAVLTACAHGGMVEQAKECFKCMTNEYGLTADMHHYAAMVDVLGRAGRLKEAFDFIQAMPVEPSAPVLGALLASCGLHQEMNLGNEVGKLVMSMEPENASNYVFLSNMLAQCGRWDDVREVREAMRSKGLHKTPGSSLIHGWET